MYVRMRHGSMTHDAEHVQQILNRCDVVLGEEENRTLFYIDSRSTSWHSKQFGAVLNREFFLPSRDSRPRLGRLASRSGGCGPVGQATETIMGRKYKC